MGERRIYLDHAATSWPKPEGVLEECDRYARLCGAAAGRGSYRSAVEADAVIASTRQLIARQIGAANPQSISLHAGGTAALNAAIHGLVRAGDHVVTTAAEHNSVLRPLWFWKRRERVELTIVDVDKTGCVDAERLLEAVGDKTTLVAVTHASNVTGAVQPIEAIAAGLRNRPASLLIDAAQTFGYLPIDVDATAIDLLAAPGHKGGGGPLGTGFLYASPTVQKSIVPVWQGGTGSQSESLEMPTEYPFSLEAGNLNVPALAGWNVALSQAIDERGDRKLPTDRLQRLASRLHRRLAALDIRVFGAAGPLPIASVNVESLPPHDLANILDAQYGIETRAGWHCAALIHKFIGSGPAGTLRISGGHGTQEAEIDAAADALAEVMQM